jgi:hypothetical protein
VAREPQPCLPRLPLVDAARSGDGVPQRDADERLVAAVTTEISLGDLLRWQGRTFRVAGFEPMSLPDRRVELEDVETGATILVPLATVARADEASAAA